MPCVSPFSPALVLSLATPLPQNPRHGESPAELLSWVWGRSCAQSCPRPALANLGSKRAKAARAPLPHEATAFWDVDIPKNTHFATPLHPRVGSAPPLPHPRASLPWGSTASPRGVDWVPVPKAPSWQPSHRGIVKKNLNNLPMIFILKAERGPVQMLVWVASLGRSWRARGGTWVREHPLLWTCPRSRTLPVGPNSQRDLARLFGAEAREETCPAHPGGAGWGGSLPTACLCPCPVLMSKLHNEKLLYFVNRVRHPSPPLHARSGWLLEPRLPPSLSSAAFCNVLMGFLAWVVLT